MVQTITDATLAPLHSTDGSAAYSHNGFSIIGGVNGPVEVLRRDELPEEAAIDVVVRPVAGVGGIRERHLESIIESTLRRIIVVTAHPRTLIQVTLQVIATQEVDSMFGVLPQAASNIQLLPALLQTSILALLASSIPLFMTLTSTLIAVDSIGKLLQDPPAKQVHTASSIHVLAFSSHGDLLVVESEGAFSIDTWSEVAKKAKNICQGHSDEDGSREDVDMDEGGQMTLEDLMRNTVKEKISREQRWKENLGPMQN